MTDNTPKLLSEHRAFGGLQRFVEHRSLEIGLPMRFSVYLPRRPHTSACRPCSTSRA